MLDLDTIILQKKKTLTTPGLFIFIFSCVGLFLGLSMLFIFYLDSWPTSEIFIKGYSFVCIVSFIGIIVPFIFLRRIHYFITITDGNVGFGSQRSFKRKINKEDYIFINSLKLKYHSSDELSQNEISGLLFILTPTRMWG